MDQVKLKSQHG